MNIIEFLEARIAEDEAQANAVELLSSEVETISTHHLPEFAEYQLRWQPRAVRAECAAKRAMIAELFLYEEGMDGVLGDGHTAAEIKAGRCGLGMLASIPGLRILAAAYANHPDYSPDWTCQ